MLASKVYPLTTPLLTLRDSELGKQQLEHPVMEIFFTSSIKAKNWLASSPDERLQLMKAKARAGDAQS